MTLDEIIKLNSERADLVSRVRRLKKWSNSSLILHNKFKGTILEPFGEILRIQGIRWRNRKGEALSRICEIDDELDNTFV